MGKRVRPCCAEISNCQTPRRIELVQCPGNNQTRRGADDRVCLLTGRRQATEERWPAPRLTKACSLQLSDFSRVINALLMQVPWQYPPQETQGRDRSRS